MPTIKPKSNVARSAKKSSFKFKWWYAAIAVLIVAVAGIAVIRFSQAGVGTTYTVYLGTNYYSPSGWAYSNSRLYNQGNVEYGSFYSGALGTQPAKVWTYSTSGGKKYGCLKTTNFKNITKADLPSGSGPYQFVEKADNSPCT